MFPHTLRADWALRWRSLLEEREQCLLLIARRDGHAVGFANAHVAHHPLVEQSVCLIEDLYVRPEARREGLGEALLERVVSWCRTVDVGQLSLGVNAANAIGMNFWRKAGFQVVSQTMMRSLAGQTS